ncbi:MAG: four helix bundle protein [Salinivirgaceae bacterium]|nr:four helix bundle protein [Salinivirgaceae bacterium]
MKSYKDLQVWNKAMDLTTMVYDALKTFPPKEEYGLSSQMRRSSVSIPSNIAEGYGRNSTLDYCRFLQIALGSAYELETQVELAHRLNYIDNETTQMLAAQLSEVGRMLNSMINKIKPDKDKSQNTNNQTDNIE